MKIKLVLSVYVSLILIITGCSKKTQSPTEDIPEQQSANFWKPLAVPELVNCSATDPAGVIWAGTDYGVYKSSDGGASWTKAPAAGMTMTKTTAVRISAAGNVYAAAGTALFAYNSSAASWTNISQNMNTTLITFSHLNNFSLDKDGNIYASMYISEKTDPQSIGMDKNVLYKSTNRGQSWTEIKISQNQGAVRNIAFSSTGAVYIIMDAAVYASSDGAKTWVKSVSSLSSANPFMLSVNSKGTVYAATGNGVLKSQDNALNWNTAGWTTYCLTMSVNSSDRLFIGGINSVYTSGDNGTSWQQVSSGLTYTISGFSDARIQGFDSNGYAYCILESVLYKSTVSTL